MTKRPRGRKKVEHVEAPDLRCEGCGAKAMDDSRLCFICDMDEQVQSEMDRDRE